MHSPDFKVRIDTQNDTIPCPERLVVSILEVDAR
jgi:hypothetical protein